MSLVLSIANAKGGSGKTTTAKEVATELAGAGYSIHVVDMDPQASFTRWFRQRTALGIDTFSCEAIPTGLLEESLADLRKRKDLDIIVVDCPGNIEDITMKTLRLSDAVLCPVRSTAIDIEATKSMAKLIETIREGKREIRFMVFHNAKHPARRLDRQASASLARIFKPGAHTFVLETAITDTTAIAEAGMTGKSVMEYAPASSSAKLYRKLIKEILQCLKSAQA